MSTLLELELEHVSPALLEILRRQGMTRLTQFQQDSINAGILRGKDLILVTHDYDEAYEIAEIAMLNRVASDFRARALLLCPNPHQAEKRMRSIGAKCGRLGLEVTPIMRRRTATGSDLRLGRVIVGTYSSVGTALRIHPEILQGIAEVVAERLDLIGQPKIGPLLETVLVNLLGREEQPQYISITPPVTDLEDLAHWLRAVVVRDPKPEVKRIFSVKVTDTGGRSLAELAEFVHYKQGQVMILSSNVATCERLAIALTDQTASPGSTLELRLSTEMREQLHRLASEIEKIYPECRTTKTLARTVRAGVAFFHEGLPKRQRRLISSAWDSNRIPVIIMPTQFVLASGMRATVLFLMGVFTQDIGNELSQDSEMHMLSEWQLADALYAAGRAKIDNEAFGIVVVDSESEKRRVIDRYFDVDETGALTPRLGEVDSYMDQPESVQDLLLGHLYATTDSRENLFALLNRTYFASKQRTVMRPHTADITSEEVDAEALIRRRTTSSTLQRAMEIPDSSVRFVSVTPNKIEGVVRSGSREIWHYITIRDTQGATCSCESWKYQAARQHRLCKHLVKFAAYALKNEETKTYASSIILQSLRGLDILSELEREGLVSITGGNARCTIYGQSAALLGIPVDDIRQVIQTITTGRGDLKEILTVIVSARTALPRQLIRRVIDSLPVKRIEELVREDDMPGVIENIIEEIQYTNAIVLRLMAGGEKQGLYSQSLELQREILLMLDDSEQYH